MRTDCLQVDPTTILFLWIFILCVLVSITYSFSYWIIIDLNFYYKWINNQIPWFYNLVFFPRHFLHLFYDILIHWLLFVLEILVINMSLLVNLIREQPSICEYFISTNFLCYNLIPLESIHSLRNFMRNSLTWSNHCFTMMNTNSEIYPSYTNILAVISFIRKVLFRWVNHQFLSFQLDSEALCRQSN